MHAYNIEVESMPAVFSVLILPLILLPAIETVLQSMKRITNVNPIQLLVVCLAGMLAVQATTEAAMLLKFHNGMGSQVVIGGTNMSTEARRLRNEPFQIVIVARSSEEFRSGRSSGAASAEE